MTSTVQNSPYTHAQIKVWLRGLLTIAWADGQFEEAEKSIIHAMVESEFAPSLDFETLEPIEPAALAELGLSNDGAQDFLRMAVMVALADGVYSEPENEQIMAFAQALALDEQALESLRSTLSTIKEVEEAAVADIAADAADAIAASSLSASPEPASAASSTDVTSVDRQNAPAMASSLQPPTGADKHSIDPLKPARDWLDQLSVEDPRLARFVCKLVPAQCPFERDVKLFGRKVVHIPPMCKLNPLYEQLVGLRFRSLCYLADDCGEDISAYT
ncbi:MAG: Mo-dependent nitrogenase C-terminal domain-containing protein [Cyanobacteria bacterium J06598_3]